MMEWSVSAVVLCIVCLAKAQAAEALSVRRVFRETRRSLLSDNVVRSNGEFEWVLRNVANKQFLVDIQIGGQNVTAIPDTGSFGLLVASKRCPDNVCRFERAFDPAQSKTYAEEDGSRGAIFGSGKLWLQAAEDELTLPGFAGPRRQDFWEITKAGKRMGSLWKSADFGAVLGLSWRATEPAFAASGGADAPSRTVLETFGAEAFTVCLGKVELLPNQPVRRTPSFVYWTAPGRVRLPPRPGEPPAEMAYLEVAGENHWAVALSGVSVSHATEKNPWKASCHEAPCAALIDTGSSVLAAPVEAYRFLRQLIGVVKEDCSNFLLLPTVQMTLGASGGKTVDVALQPHAYVQRQAVTFWGTGKVSESCYLRLVPHTSRTSSGNPLWILGIPFLQDYLCEFDRTGPKARIGFAPHPGECPSLQEIGLAQKVGLSAGSAREAPSAASDAPRGTEPGEAVAPDALSLAGELVGLRVEASEPPEANASATLVL